MDRAVADSVLELVSAGQSLRKACKELGTSAPTFLRWCNESAELAEQYARARAAGTDAEFEKLAELEALTPERGPSGTIDPGWVAWMRLQVDTKKWELSKKAPRKYGDKIETTHEVGESVTKFVREIVRA